jgi:hypothetical protein
MDDEIDDGAALGAAADELLSEAPREEYGGGAEAADGLASSAEPRRRDAQARIDAVTRARREAERERDYWRKRASGGGGMPFSDGPSGLPEGFEFMDPRSRGPAGRDEREGDDENIAPRDLIQQVREQARAELIAEAAAFEAAESARGAAAVWEDRQATFAAAQPDYVEAVMGSTWVCSETMADAIQDSDAGPALAYHLASHPEQAAAIAALSPLGQVRALGRIEAGLTEGSGRGAGMAMSISAAPAPPPSVRGSGGRFRPAPDTDDFAAFDRAYGAR